mgnify:CR=1 FL=1
MYRIVVSKQMKFLKKKYQKELWICIIHLFAFIIYRRCIINRIPYRTLREGLTPKKKISGSLIEQTGKKINIVKKRGKGQHEKMQDMKQIIEHVNKELDKKMNE